MLLTLKNIESSRNRALKCSIYRGERIAKYDYSGNNGEIIKMFMSDDAKIADYKTIMAEFAKTVTQQIRNTDYGQIVADVGQYAAMKGYDAIALNGYMKHDYVILLNRAKGIVEE